MRWSLNVDNFTFADRLKVAAFVLDRRNRLTMDKNVEKIEREFGKMSRSLALFVSSGSTANSLLVETYKQLHGNEQTVVVPTTTWSTSINPWLQAGFNIQFCDVNVEDFSLDLDRLAVTLALTPKAIVFCTSLIGFTPNMWELQRVCHNYDAQLFMDNCENTLGTFNGESLLSFGTNTTSTYFGHQICSVEGGFLFTSDKDFYATAKMIRNHGLTRALSMDAYESLEKLDWEQRFATVDPQFLFARVGNNFRNTEINALFGLLDFKRKDEYIARRKAVYRYFYEQIDHQQYYLPDINVEGREHVPFCLPLICKDKFALEGLKKKLELADIEYRPIVGGNLLVQPIYAAYADSVDNHNSRMLHNRGLYVGLHHKVSYGDINLLCEIANQTSE